MIRLSTYSVYRHIRNQANFGAKLLIPDTTQKFITDNTSWTSESIAELKTSFEKFTENIDHIVWLTRNRKTNKLEINIDNNEKKPAEQVNYGLFEDKTDLVFCMRRDKRNTKRSYSPEAIKQELCRDLDRYHKEIENPKGGWVYNKLEPLSAIIEKQKKIQALMNAVKI